MSESPASPASSSGQGSDSLSDHIKGNYLFYLVLLLIILAPPAAVYFGPIAVSGFPYWTWVGVAWGVALALLLWGDEVAVRGEANLSSGMTQPGRTSYRLFRNPMFLLTVAGMLFLPTLVAYYGPPLFLSTPDWLWIAVAWVVAALAAWLAYATIVAEDKKAA